MNRLPFKKRMKALGALVFIAVVLFPLAALADIGTYSGRIGRKLERRLDKFMFG